MVFDGLQITLREILAFERAPGVEIIQVHALYMEQMVKKVTKLKVRSGTCPFPKPGTDRSRNLFGFGSESFVSFVVRLAGEGQASLVDRVVNLVEYLEEDFGW